MWYKIFVYTVICVMTCLVKKLYDSGPNKIKFYFKSFIFNFASALVAAVIWPYFLLSPKNVRNAKVAARILKHVTKLYNLEWHLRDGKVLAEDRGAVIISNHQSSLDILGMFNLWEIINKLAPIAKKELFYIWPMGLTAYLAGVVFIDRSNAKAAYKQLQVTYEVMVKNKTKIWLFPEGTRNKHYRKLLPFKKGAFNIAVAAQVPIIPVVFSPYYFINREKYIFDKGYIIVQCLEPVPTTGLTMEDVPELINKTHEKMTQVYNDLSKEVVSSLPPDYPFTLKESIETDYD